MRIRGSNMAVDEKVISKKEIDEYIRWHYQPDDGETSGKGFFEILTGTRKYLSGRRDITGTYAAGDTLQFLLDKIRSKVELTFSEKLIELIREKGKKPAEIYKRADVDKALFSKIKGDKNYHTTKGTALAFAIALHFSLKETQDLIGSAGYAQDLIGRAGYALSSSIKRDLIVRCYIESRTYNIIDLNEKLMDYGYDPLTNKCGA